VFHDYRTRGLSQFGIAFAAMAFTCGPHHLIHGIHALEGFDVSGLMTASMVVSIPPGVTAVGLRVESMLGGRGDRTISGTPAWLIATAIAAILAAGALGALAIERVVHGHHLVWMAFVPNVAVAVTYAWVGVLLFRTQLRRRAERGGWSLSGLALGAVFPTCALTHVVYALSARGDAHIAPVDQLAVPASVYFVWVVYQLHREALVDWNRRPIVGRTRRAERPSPWDLRRREA